MPHLGSRKEFILGVGLQMRVRYGHKPTTLWAQLRVEPLRLRECRAIPCEVALPVCDTHTDTLAQRLRLRLHTHHRREWWRAGREAGRSRGSARRAGVASRMRTGRGGAAASSTRWVRAEGRYADFRRGGSIGTWGGGSIGTWGGARTRVLYIKPRDVERDAMPIEVPVERAHLSQTGLQSGGVSIV